MDKSHIPAPHFSLKRPCSLVMSLHSEASRFTVAPAMGVPLTSTITPSTDVVEQAARSVSKGAIITMRVSRALRCPKVWIESVSWRTEYAQFPVDVGFDWMLSLIHI